MLRRLDKQIYPLLSRGVLQVNKDPYNLTIGEDFKFVWYRVAKVGTRTIKATCHDNMNGGSIKEFWDIHIPYKKYQDYFHFAFVRNPFDRVVSAWLNKVRDQNSPSFGIDVRTFRELKKFPVFVDYLATLELDQCNCHFRRQSKLIDLSQVNFLGRMETFEDDLATVFSRIGVEVKSFSVKNRTENRRPYEEYYSPKIIDKVASLYESDLRMFGYDF